MSTVNGTTGSSAANNALNSTPRGMASLKSEDFFKILTTELRQQDPFEPTKTSDMISQVSQIRDIELNGTLTNTLNQLTQAQTTNGVGGWIGKYIAAKSANADGSPRVVGGVVTGVHITDDGTSVLELDTGENVLAKDVTLVTTPENAQAALNSANANANNGQNTAGSQNAGNAGSNSNTNGTNGGTAKAQTHKRSWMHKLADMLTV